MITILRYPQKSIDEYHASKYYSPIKVTNYINHNKIIDLFNKYHSRHLQILLQILYTIYPQHKPSKILNTTTKHLIELKKKKLFLRI